MSVTLLQTEMSYEVVYNEKEYTVVVLEDAVSLGYTNYDVLDEYGDIVEGPLEDEIIHYLESNID
jgi:hypothetical protein